MDTISDMLIRIKNAQAVRHESVDVPHSKLKAEILKVLQDKGFVGETQKKGKKIKKFLNVTLLYAKDGSGKINGVRRISKSSCRVYAQVSELRPIRQGTGIAVLSTPKGILTDAQARKEKVGGEVMFQIW
jgi:small subunit ribosomal protein S8